MSTPAGSDAADKAELSSEQIFYKKLWQQSELERRRLLRQLAVTTQERNKALEKCRALESNASFRFRNADG
jgi:hypothetical protein